MRPTIITLLILNLGQILSSDFDRPYALTNALVYDVSNVIATFVYTYGIRGLQFSLTTAVGLFQSVVCVIFLFASQRPREEVRRTRHLVRLSIGAVCTNVCWFRSVSHNTR